MKYQWINQNKNSQLLIFFNGWAMDGQPLRHLACLGYDVLEINDYSDSDLNIDLSQLARQYDKTILLAWSLGVWAAGDYCQRHNFKPDFALAINGTNKPIDADFGIAADIFQGTIDNLDIQGLASFQRRMCKSRDVLEFFDAHKPARNIDLQRAELVSLQAHIYARPVANNIFDKAIVALQDRIMPPANQMAYWAEQTVAVVEINQPHYPFMAFASWREILDLAGLAQPDKNLITQRFARSLKTYPANAPVQQQIAGILLDELIDVAGCEYENIVEVGCGAGLLTQMIEKQLNYQKLFLNDLVPQCQQLAASIEASEFIPGDIEQLPYINDDIDLLISSSTFQWLGHLEKTLAKFARWLGPGGILAFSTFGPDNFKEIAQLTGKALHYPDANQLKKMLEKNFEVLTCYEKHYYCQFPDGRAVLEHLKKTGVAAISSQPWTRGDLKRFNDDYIRNFSQDDKVMLTYHPLIVIACVQ